MRTPSKLDESADFLAVVRQNEVLMVCKSDVPADRPDRSLGHVHPSSSEPAARCSVVSAAASSEQVRAKDMQDRCVATAPEADPGNAQVVSTKGLRTGDSRSATKAQLSDDARSHSLTSLVRDDPQLAFLCRHWPALSPHVREAVMTLIAADLMRRGERHG